MLECDFWRHGEITRLLLACDEELYPIVVCALMTGMRQGEILRLRWEHIDLANGIIYVLRTKSGAPREIPIASKLSTVLKGLIKGDGGPVFTLLAYQVQRRFAGACKLAGIEGFHFHDLRPHLRIPLRHAYQ